MKSLETTKRILGLVVEDHKDDELSEIEELTDRLAGALLNIAFRCLREHKTSTDTD